MPACWHREYESKTAPAAAPELTVGPQRLIIAFVPRPAVSEALHHALGSCTDATSCRVVRPQPPPAHHADCRVAVLHGTGGVGKTQLALAHARLPRCRSAPYRLRWWIAAEQRDGLQAQYREFAQTAGIPVDVNCAFSALVSVVNAWLSARPDWLVVFDDAHSYDHLADIVPPTPHPSQHVIITSRHTQWPAAYRTVFVDVMDEAEAMQLLKAGAGVADGDQSQDADISQLAAELGRLPLTLPHAAAYVKQRRITFSAASRTRYMESGLFDSKRDKRPTGDPYPHAVAQTWDVSIAAVDDEAKEQDVPPLGRALLTACAYLALDAIPHSLLRRWLSSSGLLPSEPSAAVGQPASLLSRWLPASLSVSRQSDTRPATAVIAASANIDVVLDALLGALSRYSLLYFDNAEKPLIRLHRVLARVLRHQHQQQQQQAPAAAAAVASRCPAFDSAWRSGMVAAVTAEYKASSPSPGLRDRRLMPHLQSLQRCFDRSGAGSDWEASLARAELLYCLAGAYLHRLDDYRQAKELAEQALPIYQALFVYPDGQQGICYKARSRLADAESLLAYQARRRQLLERSLLECQAQPGGQGELARTLAALGSVCISLGDPGKALEYLQRALPMQEAHLGTGHEQVATTLSKMGRLYAALDDPIRQREVLERALAIDRAVFGDEHVRVALTLQSLADMHRAAGNPEKAVKLFKPAAQI